MKIACKLSLPALVLLACAGAGAGADEGAAMARTPSPPGARVYIVSPRDGATVHSPVHVVFGLSGMGVAPAGVDSPNTGHHHLLVDAPLPALDQPIPKDAQHLHFGGGQTETELTLSPGPHTLQLLLGDKAHVPHDPPIFSAQIKVTVLE
jgi:Domain of unknown function (DUF4399)